jgi:hypothetical protein
MKFRIRSNMLRLEEEQGIISYTNNQQEIERYMNQMIKGKILLNDLRIRKNDDGLPKELINMKIPTLNRREKVIRTIENYKNLKKEWKEKVKRMRTKITHPEVEVIERETDR